MVDIEFTGINEIVAKLEAMGQKTSKAITPILEEAAEPVLEAAKSSTAFKDTETPEHDAGFLRDAIKKSKVKAGVIWVGDVDNATDKYSYYVEFGHKNQYGKMVPAHPYLRPALQNNKVKIREIIRARLQEALK